MLQVLAPFYSNLSGLILLPLLGSLIILVIPNSRVRLIQGITIWTSLITFLYSLFFWIRFENDTAKFQFVETIRWLPYSNINFYIGIDGISLFFVILTTFLTPICILVGFYSVKSYKKEYMIAFFICESFLIAVFCSLDLLIFYVFFESVLIPMFIIIGVWGSRQRKIKAAYQFFLYTLMGSLLCATLVLVSLRATKPAWGVLCKASHYPCRESLKGIVACGKRGRQRETDSAKEFVPRARSSMARLVSLLEVSPSVWLGNGPAIMSPAGSATFFTATALERGASKKSGTHLKTATV
jgi:hypothetical protein